MTSNDPWSELGTQYAAVSDDVRQHFLHPAVMATVSALPQRGRCLEYGCGPGQLAAALRGPCGSVVAVDRAPAALAAARLQLGPEAAVLDPAAWAATTENFDVIVLCLVMTTVADDVEIARILTALRQRLTPEGRLILATTHPCYTFRALSQIRYSDAGAAYRVPIGPGIEVTEYHRPLASVLNLLADAGLRIEHAAEIADDPGYYAARGELVHRFAGLLPMFLLLTCAGMGGAK